MKKHYYYFDCPEQDKFFEYLDNLVDEGSISYDTDGTDIITIYELYLDDEEQRKMYKKIDDFNVIEDLDYSDVDDVMNEDMDDYRDEFDDNDEDYDF